MRKELKNNKGAALILTVLLTVLILLLGLYFLSFSLTEKRISRSQISGVKTYYLAEAGIADMIWKLKNDPAYKTAFESNPAYSQSFTRTDPFGADSGSYTVTVANSALARGEITSVGTIAIGGGKTSQRIVKTQVYKAMGTTGIGTNGGYADGNIDINGSKVNFFGGSAHSNGNFIINLFSDVNIEGDLNANGNYNKSWFSDVIITGAIHAKNYQPAAPVIAMPAIDFNSSDPNSYKSRASAVYTSAQFDTLMANNQNLTLPGPITYVSGDIDVRGAQNLIINGVLAAERDFVVGKSRCRGARCGNSSVTVNHTAGQPSGILARRKIEFESFTSNVFINGLAYANDQFNINGIPFFGAMNFNIIGAAVGRKLYIFSCWQPINITYSNENIVDALGASTFSPVITVEHWEEEY